MKKKSVEDINILASIISGIIFTLYNALGGYNSIFQKVTTIGAGPISSEFVITNYSMIINGFITGFATLFLSLIIIQASMKKFSDKTQYIISILFSALIMVIITVKNYEGIMSYLTLDTILSIAFSVMMINIISILITMFIQNDMGEKK
jgi:hypothetical protein